MSITSLGFLIFAAVLTAAYYLVPRRFSWCVLLAGSLAFYALCCPWGLVFVLFTATTVYAAARWIGSMAEEQRAYLKECGKELSRSERAEYSAAGLRRRRAVLIAALVVNFALLAACKLAAVFTPGTGGVFAVLGISFYTLQSTGYLVDVYWENAPAERNYLKSLLFTCFFAQMTQGPISDYAELSRELFTPRGFSWENGRNGVRRMAWGFAKKMILADGLAPFVQTVFSGYGGYSGLTALLGAFGYSVRIYADFSGYMDIMCGLCEVLGIRLAENFDLPYLSGSVAEYWRRWHMTLGAWFRKYVYYPIALSGWAQGLGRAARKRLGKHAGQTLPATAALVSVWIITGLWHGVSWEYLAWGAVNGAFIIASLWLAPVWENVTSRLHLTDGNRLWRAFRIVRTFVLMTAIKVLPEVGTLGDGIAYLGRVFTAPFLPGSATEILPGLNTAAAVMLLVCTAVLAASDLIARKKPLRSFVDERPAAARFALYCCLVFSILVFASYGRGYDPVDFMYFRF